MSIWVSFKDVEYVVAIAEEGSLSKAADKLHVSQPALSIFISKLEDRLGVKLFERKGKKFILTYAGECVVNEGKNIRKSQDIIENKLQEIANFRQGRFRVGFPNIRGITMFPAVASRFKVLYPNVNIEVCEEDARILENMLDEGKLDLIFFNRYTDGFLERDDLEQELILSDPMVLFVNKNHPLCSEAVIKEGFNHPWIDLRKFKNEKFILNFENQSTYRISKSIFKDMGFYPEIALQIKNQLTAIQLASIGYGVYMALECFLFSLLIKEYPITLSFGDNAPYTMDFVATWPKNSGALTLINSFVSMTKEVYNYNTMKELFARNKNDNRTIPDY